jgi:hypothetical protein
MTVTINGTSGIAGVDGSAGTPAIQGGDANTGVFFPAADTVAIGTGGSERMRIASTGDVGIGTTSPSAPIDVVSNSSAIGTRIRGRSSDSYGVLEFTNNAASAETARIAADSSDNLIFSNTGSITERMRIDSGGFTYINCTSSVASVSSYSNILFNGVAYFGMSIKTSYGSAGSTFAAFINSAGTQQGSIYANATNTVQYLTSSDYRLKENIAPMTGALAKVSALKPVTYNWKSDGSSSQGFIAHELAEVSPECVGGEKDAVDADGNPKYQGIDTSFLVATLTAAIQEQQALITALTARITALEAK